MLCLAGQIHYRTDARQDGCRTGRKQDILDAGQEKCSAGWMQGRTDAGQDRYIVLKGLPGCWCVTE